MSELNIDIVATGSHTDTEINRVRRALDDEIAVTSVLDMVDNITGWAVTSDDTIRRLRIFAHGEPGVLSFYPLASHSFQAHARIMYHPGSPSNVLNGVLLQRLNCLFSSDGWVELHCCNIAKGRDGAALMSGLAQIFGVPVKAGSVIQYSGGGIEGTTFIAYPGGSIHRR